MDQERLQKLEEQIQSMKKEIDILNRSRVHNNMTLDTRYNIVTSVISDVTQQQLASINPHITFNYKGKQYNVPLTNYVIAGAGAPTGISAIKGTLYTNTTAITTITRLYVNTDGGTTWATFTASA